MATEHKVPNFKSEQEEAAWWDAHPEVIAELFLKARKEGRIKRLPPSMYNDRQEVAYEGQNLEVFSASTRRCLILPGAAVVEP